MGKLIRRRLYLIRHERQARELAEEMGFHRSMSGTKVFGNTTRARGRARGVGLAPSREAWQDVRYALRSVRRQGERPGVRSASVTTVGSGL